MATTRCLSSRQFEQEFGPLYRTIFGDRPLVETPFQDPEWRVLLLPYGSNMSPQDIDSMLVAASAFGDADLIVKDAETIAPAEAAIVCEATRDAFEAAKARAGSTLGLMDLHLFGRSGRWGCVCAASLDDIALLGGDRDFIRKFLEAVGGEQDLRNRYVAFAVSEWSVDQDVRARLLTRVGWSPDEAK